ncbi:hypothetical protein NUW54_g12728 [Trametes sanguinea]|uniref:Uncharacterized protein n=1 Tax=Trametes sanguinea TaxID=158606 RepID=A0ACC1MW03_9APHY|nr:hypothetical protein NUW54_g12728 [Trametes sanguinea]
MPAREWKASAHSGACPEALMAAPDGERYRKRRQSHLFGGPERERERERAASPDACESPGNAVYRSGRAYWYAERARSAATVDGAPSGLVYWGQLGTLAGPEGDLDPRMVYQCEHDSRLPLSPIARPGGRRHSSRLGEALALRLVDEGMGEDTSVYAGTTQVQHVKGEFYWHALSLRTARVHRTSARSYSDRASASQPKGKRRRGWGGGRVRGSVNSRAQNHSMSQLTDHPGALSWITATAALLGGISSFPKLLLLVRAPVQVLLSGIFDARDAHNHISLYNAEELYQRESLAARGRCLLFLDILPAADLQHFKQTWRDFNDDVQ